MSATIIRLTLFPLIAYVIALIDLKEIVNIKRGGVSLFVIKKRFHYILHTFSNIKISKWIESIMISFRALFYGSRYVI